MTVRARVSRWQRASGCLALTMAAAGLLASAPGASASARPPQTGSASIQADRGPAAPAAPVGRADSSRRQDSAVSRPLAGKIIGIDPGHNGRNYTDPSFINHLIWNGREWEACDTTGTETASGYTEARYNFNVARYLRADLRRAGARVVMTRDSNRGIGPCVNKRAWILNRAHVNVAIDIHADWFASWGRGFAILEPVRDGPNNHVIRASERFGRDVRSAFRTITGMPISNYDGTDGIKFRDDLAGLNLTRVPKMLIECGNMNNATDARLLTSASFQRKAARALAAAIIRFLRRR